MHTKDGVKIAEGMSVYLETPEGRIEGTAAKTSELPPRKGMVHVIFEVYDIAVKDELCDGDGWWPLDKCYSKPS